MTIANIGALERSLRFTVHGESAVTTRMPRSLVRAIEMWAQAHEVSRSEAMRRLVELGAAHMPLR